MPRRHHNIPHKVDSEGIIRWMVDHDDGLQMNGGKGIDYSLARRRHWISRDRNAGNHYMVEVRGNMIRGYVGCCEWPDGRRSRFEKDALLLETPLAAYQSFLLLYKQLTPDLDWW